MEKITEEIRIWGVVQGVGFRPYIARIAEKLGINGQVHNVGGLVRLYVTAEVADIDAFLSVVQNEQIDPIEIIHIDRKKIEYKEFEGFRIQDSKKSEEGVAIIPADIAICDSCVEEFRDPRNRRHNHSFNSCMLCGPRYTIIESLPYDRERTTMTEFSMCEKCQAEYTDLHDRRYHAQTISCNECGPKLLMKYRNGNIKFNEKFIVKKAARTLMKSGVLAFKSMGGYNLVCKYGDNVAEEKIRRIKGRDEKPFAIMFKDVEQIKEIAIVSEVEEKMLTSSARPIVLLKSKEKKERIGVFLPSMAAQMLILNECQVPLVFTSCNISSSPIIIDDKEMADFFAKEEKIDFLIYNNRKILKHVDDSVVREIDGQPQIIRRSKGIAPTPLFLGGEDENILAMGGDLKSTFSITKGNFVYPSQYFGDMDNLKLQKTYKDNLLTMCELFSVSPEVVVCDMHPRYWTSKLGKEISEKYNIPLIKVQHHHAHVASVMAEHALDEKVIGVVFDGTGYGDDGNVWGGEVLICQEDQYERYSHLKYTDYIGGDSMAKEAWKAAACLIAQYGFGQDSKAENSTKIGEFGIKMSDIIYYGIENKTLLEYSTSANYDLVKAALNGKINTVISSSMGRVFDGVAALLGICGKNEFEGQCAIALEDHARLARTSLGKSVETKSLLALDFHNRISQGILKEAIKVREVHNINVVVLSGGVFQNDILMEETLRLLREKDFEVYFNTMVSPNDGGISLGQAYIASHRLRKSRLKK